jgi:hypothetical protein
MACIKCKRNRVGIRFAHLPGEVCAECFAEIVEKRVRRDVRIGRLFSDAKKILVLDEGSENAAVCSYFVKALNEYSDVEFISKKISSLSKLSGKEIAGLCRKLKADRVVLPWNGSQESEFLLKSMILKGGYEKEDKRVIKLLKHLSQREVEMFAKINGLRYKARSGHYDADIGSFLDKLEKESPDIRFALVKSFEKIGNSG